MNRPNLLHIALLMGFLMGAAAGPTRASTADAEGPESPALLTLEKGQPEVVEGPDTLEQTIEKIRAAHRKPDFQWTETDGLKLLAVGHESRLREWLDRILARIHTPGDATQYKIRLSSDLSVNARVFRNRKPPEIVVNLGLLFFAESEDAIAGVLAHELTHSNPLQFRALHSNSTVETILKQVESSMKLEASQREEIRADLGAIQRMLDGGYNPWGYYDLHRRIAEQVQEGKNHAISEAFANHPKSEIRMTTVKAAMLEFAKTRDLSNAVAQMSPLPEGIRTIEARARLGLAVIQMRRAVATNALFMKTEFWESARALKELLGRHKAKTLAVAVATVAAIPHLPDMMAWATRNPGAIAGGAVSVAVGGTVLAALTSPPGDDFEIRSLLSRQEPLLKEKVPNIEDLISCALKGEDYLSYKGKLPALFRQQHEQIIGRVVQAIEQQGQVGWSKFSVKDKEILLGAAEIRSPRVRAQLAKSFSFEPIPPSELARLKSRLQAFDQSVQRVAQETITASLELGSADTVEEVAKRRVKYDLLNKRFSALMRSPERMQLASSVHLLRDAVEKGEPGVTVLDFYLARILLGGMGNYSHFRGRTLGRDEQFLYRHHSDLLDEAVRRSSELGPTRPALQNFYGQLSGDLLDKDLKKFKGRPLEEQWKAFSLSGGITKRVGTRLRPPWRGNILYAVEADAPLWRDIQRQTEARFSEETQGSPIPEIARWYKDKISFGDETEGYASKFFNSLVTRHPDWIRSVDDIDALLGNEIFWVSSGLKEFTNDSKFEALLTLWRNNKGARYVPGKSEDLHRLITRKLKEFGQYPATFEGKRQLWERLSARGVTFTSKSLYSELRADATPEQRRALDLKALKEDWLWNGAQAAAIVEEEIRSSPEWKQLSEAAEGQRNELLERLLKKTSDRFPKRGMQYQELLERMSRDLKTTEAESALFSSFRTLKAGEWTEDAVLRAYSGLLTEALSWKPEQQWDLVRFLRGEPPTELLRTKFENLGTERVFREFQELKPEYKAAMLDSFLSGPKGLLKKMDLGAKYPKRIVDHLMQGNSGKSRSMAREMLEGFLYSLQATGNERLQSSVLAFLLARPVNPEVKVLPAETLKAVLEVYGATGVKIGQFLTTAGVLSEADSRILSELQDRAKIPLREELYADLRKIYGGQQPYELKEVLGAASMKVAVRAIDTRTGEEVVLKILREEAVVHTPQEFKQLRAMVDFLVKKHGKKYSVLKTIVRASQEAVKQELDFAGEVARSKIAREQVYVGMSDGLQSVAPPQERLEKPRLIVAELAKGDSVKRLPEKDQDRVARKIIQMETRILSQEQGTVFFNPDTHPGNYIAQRQSDVSADSRPHLSPIDLGLLTEISAEDRQRVVKLFALAQILRETGPTKWAAREALAIRGLDPRLEPALLKGLRDFFPNRESKEIAAYFGILTAFETAGRAVPLSYLEYLRAVMQQPQYEQWISGPKSAHPTEKITEIFEHRVRQAAQAQLQSMKLGPLEKAKIAARVLKTSVIGEPGNRPCSLKDILARARAAAL